MITAGDDSGKYEQGFTTLKQTLIGFAFIAIAWFVLSMTFYVIDLVTNQNPDPGKPMMWGENSDPWETSPNPTLQQDPYREATIPNTQPSRPSPGSQSSN